jgi:hypothetical protein
MKESLKAFFPLMANDFKECEKGKTALLVDPMGNLVEVVEVLEGELLWD